MPGNVETFFPESKFLRILVFYDYDLDNNLSNYFWHQDDDYTLTSQGLIWTYPGKKTTSNSIVVMPERFDKNLEKEYNGVYGICSDYVAILREKYDTK